MSTFFAVTYGISFATLPATLSHVFLFHGKETWQQTKASLRYEEWDIHTKLMKRNYRAVPHYWFVIILVLVIGLAMFVCEGFGRQLQLPWWGVILACGIAFSFTLPIGVIQATTNQQQDLGIISQYIIGYLYPGRPFANRTFTIYTYVSITQALTFLYDFKLAHYMKIPPRSMFLAQLVGTAVAATVYFENAWWKLGSVDNLCDRSIQGNVWTCPNDNVFFSVSIIWGLIGPQRIFSNLGLYSKQNWFFLVGALAPVPVWVLSKMFPHKKWIHLINMAIFLGATLSMPPAGSVNFIIWGTMGFIFNYVIFRKYRQWWSRYNYILSGALDGGTAFMGILCYFTLQLKGNQNLKWWGGTLADDHCPFATYPTAPGVVVDGCPVFY